MLLKQIVRTKPTKPTTKPTTKQRPFPTIERSLISNYLWPIAPINIPAQSTLNRSIFSG